MQIKTPELLRQFNSLNLAASARAYVEVAEQDELLEALAWARQRNMPVLPLGEGSNVVFAGDIDALVLRQMKRDVAVVERETEHATVVASAGMNWHQLVCWALDQQLYGLENLALIPGTVGAAPIQNIGAYGVELEQYVVAVQAVDLASGESRTLSHSDCQFAYRDSIFKGELRDSLLVTAVEFQLSRQPRPHIAYPALAAQLSGIPAEVLTPRDVFNAVVQIRSSKLPDPAQIPNAGSFFKNPLVSPDTAAELAKSFPGLPQFPQADGAVKLPAAWLIDHCGWKGHTEAGVGVHPGHALVLVNYSSASGAALLSLAGKIRDSVLSTFGVQLEIEPRVYGERRE